MYAIRDKVFDKLTKFFSESRTSNEALDQEPEARLHANDGKLPPSMLSSVLTPASFSWYRPNDNANEVTSTGSKSFKWRSKSFSLKDKPLDRIESCEELETKDQNHNIDSHFEDSEHGLRRRSSSDSELFEDVFTPHSFDKAMPNLVNESLFISPDLYQFFEASLPNIVKGCQWVLLYSTARHGISLNTLIRKSVDLPSPCLLITGDKQGTVFGG